MQLLTPTVVALVAITAIAFVLVAIASRLRRARVLDAPWLVRNGWEISGRGSPDAFFASLALMIPMPTYLCFEGPLSNVRAFLERREVAAGIDLAPGTLWPKERIIHVLANEAFLRDMSALASRHAGPEICSHLHAYNAERVLLHWYDAFHDPIIVDASIPEAAVKRFCDSLNLTYAPWRVA